MNKSMKVRLVLLTAIFLVLIGIVVVAPSANAAGPNVTLKVAIRNTNWLSPTYCTSAYLRATNGTIIRSGSYSNFWWGPYGCNVTYYSVPTNVTYRFEINGNINRAYNRYFTVLFDQYVKQPSNGSTVDLGTITFYK